MHLKINTDLNTDLLHVLTTLTLDEKTRSNIANRRWLSSVKKQNFKQSVLTLTVRSCSFLMLHKFVSVYLSKCYGLCMSTIFISNLYLCIRGFFALFLFLYS